MKKYLLIFLISSCLLLTIVPTNSTSKNDMKTMQSPDLFESIDDFSRFDDTEEPTCSIQELEWNAPPGHLPGTLEEYLAAHPLEPAVFSTPLIQYSRFDGKTMGISILVDTDLYPQITTQLLQYIDDLENEGYTVVLDTVSGGTPEEIKLWVTDQYNMGSQGMVFIGDITAAWAEVSGDVFPCDLFYMDLDGKWKDQDFDGDYELHTNGFGDMGPEIYVGRIYTSSLDYDTEENMVNEYLEKVHAFRTGDLVVPWRSIEYVEEDWYDMDVFTDLIYGDMVSRDDYGFYTTADDYIGHLSMSQHFVQVCAHSYSGGHHFSTRPTESAAYAHVYVYSPTTRSARLRLGCDDGMKVWLNGENVYTNDRYGGWTADAYTISVQLIEGWNHLLCKVSQGGGDYQLSARFTDLDDSTFDDLIYQVNNPDIYSAEAPFIRSWLLNGFHQDIPDNFWNYLSTNYLGVSEGSINPSDGETMGGKVWTTYDSGYPYIDMKAYEEQDFGVCYAFTRVYAEESVSCELWTGYDDGARIWLNGNQVLFDNRYGEFTADMTKTPVSLNAGENRLLVKISEWMGEHGFSARLCTSDGSEVPGLSYDPEPIPFSYIGTWLTNGPYVNPDQSTRLSMDYLVGEADVVPSEGDATELFTWECGIGNGCPFNVGEYYNHGNYVESADIQQLDPPVLFYNLFACGPGRFTDQNYLAGAYIFHTTYGLITVASSKSGSMLNFDDFNDPLGQGATFGEAFVDWFDAQYPFDLWEQEWYYGMVLCGDPTLSLEEPEYFVLNLYDVPSYTAESEPGYHEMNGPACAQMILDYIWWNHTQHPSGPPVVFTQQQLYQSGIENNSNPELTVFDTMGMRHTIQSFRPLPYSEYGYNYNVYHSTNQTLMVERICQWINYTIGTYGGYKPGHPLHAPTVVPTQGRYDNWVLVRGIHTDTPMYPLPEEVEVYGFWVNDPYPVSFEGLGTNCYTTIAEWSDSYYLPLDTDDEYQDEYVAICEPPETQEQPMVHLREKTVYFSTQQQLVLQQTRQVPTVPTPLKQITDQWVIQAAQHSVSEHLLLSDPEFAQAYTHATPQEPCFVHDVDGDDYYLVCCAKDTGVTVAFILDAIDGSLKEVSWTTTPVSYLPISKSDAVALLSKTDGNTLKQSVQHQPVTSRLVHRDSSRYYPEWELHVDKMVYYVNQQGKVSL